MSIIKLSSEKTRLVRDYLRAWFDARPSEDLVPDYQLHALAREFRSSGYAEEELWIWHIGQLLEQIDAMAQHIEQQRVKLAELEGPQLKPCWFELPIEDGPAVCPECKCHRPFHRPDCGRLLAIAEESARTPAPHLFALGSEAWKTILGGKFRERYEQWEKLGLPVKHVPELEPWAIVPLGADGLPFDQPSGQFVAPPPKDGPYER